MTISNYLENKILDKVFNNIDFSVDTAYVSLHNSDPGKTGGGEVSGESYTRQAGTFTLAFGNSLNNVVDMYFLDLPSGVYTHAGVWDMVSSGNYLWGCALLEEETTETGGGFVVYSGMMTVTLD